MKQIESETPVATVAPEVARAEEPKPLPSFPALGKEHEITEFASTDPTRLTLNSIHLNMGRRYVEATDGRMIIRVPFEISDEFPPLGQNLNTPTEGLLLPTKDYKKAIADAAKNGVRTLPILNKVAVATNCDPLRAVLITTNLKTQLDRRVPLVEGIYPNTDHVVPTGEAPHKVTLSSGLLNRICDYAGRAGTPASGGAITFGFTDDPRDAVTFEVKTESGMAKGVMMPMRLS